MSSVFEAGLTLACIVILHNWFKETVLGTVSAAWFTAYYFQTIMQDALYRGDIETGNFGRTLMIQSYVLFGSYFFLSILSWFLFYHHPSHVGI